jgi:hypothetical protein
MGGGSWDPSTYTNTTAKRAADPVTKGFAHSHAVKTGAAPAVVHADLDPKLVDSLGRQIRESADSDEHPTATAVAVMFDVTGSMGSVPEELVKRMPALYGLLLRKGYIPDPQVLFGGVGDATCDQFPLQVGQFESDNRSDEDLTKIILEGGGGGQRTESYEMAMYFFARHTRLDSFDKRGEKGFLFFIGDEMPYPKVYMNQTHAPATGHRPPKGVLEVIGDGLQEDISTEDILAELQERYHVFYIMPAGTSYAMKGWGRLTSWTRWHVRTWPCARRRRTSLLRPT